MPANHQSVTATDVEAAMNRIGDVIDRTAVDYSDRLSDQLGAQIYLKREDLQSVRSYKLRGAFNVMLQLPASQRDRGLVCASAGNHAQGFARACRSLGIRGTVFVPRTTPQQKRDRIRFFGGTLVDLAIQGATYDEAAQAAQDYAEQTGAGIIHPFDDAQVIAGQGTVGKEICDQLPNRLDMLVVPVGGGGLLAGIVSYLRARRPEVEVIGVEPQGAACMAAGLRAGRPVRLAEVDSFVDGAAVRQAGALPLSILADAGTRVRYVPEGRVASEMIALYQTEGIIAEPAGALASAALGPVGSGAPVEVPTGATVACVISGGNNDISRYGEVLERSLVYEGLRHYFIVDFPQEPGALRRFLDQVLGPDDDISLFEYAKRSNRETGPAFVGVTLGTPADLDPLLHRMADSPLDIRRVTPDNPLYRMLI